MASSLLVNLSVALITVSVNLVTAVLIGVAISTVYSMAKMSTSVLRREYSARRVNSKRVRQAQQSRYLREHGRKILVFELQGPIFFGSADRLAMLIEKKTAEAYYCILDMKHVNEIDTTGANILVRLHQILERQKKRLLISHLVDSHFLWGFLEASGAAGAIPKENFFEDTDAALEWAEDHVLAEFYSEEDRRYYPLEETDLLQGFSPRELETFCSELDCLAFSRGEQVIREGEENRDLYILTRGSVSVKIHLPPATAKNGSLPLVPVSCSVKWHCWTATPALPKWWRKKIPKSTASLRSIRKTLSGELRHCHQTAAEHRHCSQPPAARAVRRGADAGGRIGKS